MFFDSIKELFLVRGQPRGFGHSLNKTPLRAGITTDFKALRAMAYKYFN